MNQWSQKTEKINGKLDKLRENLPNILDTKTCKQNAVTGTQSSDNGEYINN